MSGEKLGSIFGKPEDVRTYRTDKSQWVLPNQNIGVEVEVENVRQELEQSKQGIELLKLWTMVPDHSLRDGGLEFTTSGPLFGDDLDKAIDLLITTGTEFKWKSSERTGIHVHVDMRDCDQTELLLLSCLYSIVERPLFRWIGESRSENIYCLPWYKAQENLRHVAALGSISNTDMYHDIVSKIQRYSALNLASLGKYATVEFRHMDTQLDASRIKTWINLLMCMKKYTREFYKDHDNPQQLLATFSGLGPRKFAEAVFEAMLPSLAYEGMEQDLWDGLLIAQDLTILFKKKFISMSPEFELWGEAKAEGYTEYFKNKPKAPPAPKADAPMIDIGTNGRINWRQFVPPAMATQEEAIPLPPRYIWQVTRNGDEPSVSQGWAIYNVRDGVPNQIMWWWEGNLTSTS